MVLVTYPQLQLIIINEKFKDQTKFLIAHHSEWHEILHPRAQGANQSFVQSL